MFEYLAGIPKLKTVFAKLAPNLHFLKFQKMSAFLHASLL